MSNRDSVTRSLYVRLPPLVPRFFVFLVFAFVPSKPQLGSKTVTCRPIMTGKLWSQIGMWLETGERGPDPRMPPRTRGMDGASAV